MSDLTHRASAVHRRLGGAIAVGMALLAGACSDVASPGDDPVEWLGVKSYRDVRYAATVRQAQDFTCGGAALATMLKYYLGHPTTERQVLAVMQARYPDPAQWQAKAHTGFSFDDLIFAAEAFGFEAQGGKVAVDELAKLQGPVIVHLDKGTFQHFSVLRKMHDGQAYLSDPILGLVMVPVDRFSKEYTGSAMAVWIKGRPLPSASPLGVVRSGISAQRVVGPAMDFPRAVPPAPPTLR